MIILNIVEKSFGIKYLNQDLKIIKKYLVPDDYLLSPVLESNINNNEIYLEQSEYYPVEGIIIGENIELQDALYFADFYQMYNVKSYMTFISSIDSENYVKIPDSFFYFNGKLIDKLIIHILKLENELMWKDQIFIRGNLTISRKTSFSRICAANLNNYHLKDLYVENVPTHVNSYMSNPLLCWKNINNKQDIKRLLFLSIELKTEIDLDILEIATSYSSMECYPYDDYIIKNRGYLKILRITPEKIYDSLSFIEQLILKTGGEIYYRMDINKIFSPNNIFYYPNYEGKLNIFNPYIRETKLYEKKIYTNKIDKFIKSMERLTIITKKDNDYIVYYKINDFSSYDIIEIIDEPDELFNMRIYMDNGKLKVNASSEFLVYMCTGFVPIYTHIQLINMMYWECK